jgi:catechol 1,2-dioxygenase
LASREGLVPAVSRIDDPAQMDAKRVNAPFASIDFDFRLYRDTAGAPSPLVERARAAA